MISMITHSSLSLSCGGIDLRAISIVFELEKGEGGVEKKGHLAKIIASGPHHQRLDEQNFYTHRLSKHIVMLSVPSTLQVSLFWDKKQDDFFLFNKIKFFLFLFFSPYFFFFAQFCGYFYVTVG